MNPFDNPDDKFLVLVNDAGQYSLWPSFGSVPDGWTVAPASGSSREECLEYIEEHWSEV
jgi:MbtH protein